MSNKPKSGLLFRRGVEDAGFSSSKTSNAANADATTIVRELIQNSVDASKEIGRDETIIRFELEKIAQNTIPGFDDLKEAFPCALESQRKLSNGRLPDIQAQIAGLFEKSLKQKLTHILSIRDNGVGLKKETMRALLGDGRSAKGVSGGGAHGYGHLTVLPSSDLRMVYYGGKHKSEEKIASGHCVLAPFERKGKPYQKDGYLVQKLNDEDMFDPYVFLHDKNIPELISRKIDSIESEWGTGTVVIVPSFNFFKNEHKELWKLIRKAAATNFFASFAKKEIVVEFKDGENIQRLDASNIEKTLMEFEREKNARFIAGSKALDCYNTIRFGKSVNFKTAIGTISGKLNCDNKVKNTRIDLCRNGMWIVHNNSAGKQLPRLQNSTFSDYHPFHLVLMLEATSDGELHQLIRKSEPPLHDQVDVNQLSEEDKKKLQSAFSQIAKQIKDNLEEIDTEKTTMDGILTLPVGGSGRGGKSGVYAGEWQPYERTSRASSQGKSAETGPDGRETSGKKGKNKGSKNNGGSGAKPTKKAGSAAPFNAIPVPINSRKYEVEIHPLADIEAGEIRFMIDQNMDATCRFMNGEPLVRLKNVKLEGADIPSDQFIKDGNGAIIGIMVADIQENKKFHVEFDFLPPDDSVIPKEKSVALKVEMLKRKKTPEGDTHD